MAKVMTVEEALASMQPKKKKDGEIIINRFNKRNFNNLMLAMINDVNFTHKVLKTNGGEQVLQDVFVTKEFRKWCKKLIEKAGIDSNESQRILTGEFVIENIDGIYDFFTAAMYTYMAAGNRFDFPATEDFRGGIIIKDIPEQTKVTDAYNPKDHSYLGKYETTKKKHKVLRAKSTCPTFLSSKRLIK